MKKRAYEQRVNEIEHGSVTSFVFTTSGGMGKAATVFNTRLASKLADKRNQPYSVSFNWIRSSIMCLRGKRYMSFPSTPDSILLTTTDDLHVYLWFASFLLWLHCIYFVMIVFL